MRSYTRLRRERFFALSLARYRLDFVRFVRRGFFDSMMNIGDPWNAGRHT